MQKRKDKVEEKKNKKMLGFSLFLAVWLDSRLETIRKRASRAACLIRMLVQSRDYHVTMHIMNIRLCFPIRLYYISNPFSLPAFSLNTVRVSHSVDK